MHALRRRDVIALADTAPGLDANPDQISGAGPADDLEEKG
jgi:hypothetical protein